MSDADGTCEYVLDPDNSETWGGEEGDECYVEEEVLNEDGVWTCPHDSEEGENLCIFHLPVDEKEQYEIINTFIDIIDGDINNSSVTQKRRQQFIGAVFKEFDISKSGVESINPIDLTHSRFFGNADFSGIDFDGDSNFSAVDFIEEAAFVGTKFGGDVSFRGTKFEGENAFTDAEFRGDTIFRKSIFFQSTNFGNVKWYNNIDFKDSKFKQYISFSTSKCEGSISFINVKFGGETHFDRVGFREQIDFRDSKFSGYVSFARAELEDTTYFDRTIFREGADFRDAKFREKISFYECEFLGETNFVGAKFGGDANFSRVEFGGDTDFSSSDFDKWVNFSDADFESDIRFTGAGFNGVASFMSSTLTDVEFDGANLTDATFTDANLRGTNLESTLLSRATLFGSDLRGAKLSGAVLGDVRIDEDTKFLGHPSEDSDTSPHTVSAIRSQPTCVYDPDYEEDNEHADVDKAKSVYRALEELGGKHARPRLQARSFVRRQDLQKDEYKQDAKEANSWEERLIAGARWSRARVARATLLYGESPWRVIAWSLGIIFSFALLYPLGGWMKPADGDPITYAQIASNPVEILNSVYYSTLTYTALGFGDFQPVGLGRLLTTLETGLGAVMLALLVFILGRRAAR